MSRLLLTCAALMTSALLAAPGISVAQPPNIILIMLDDLDQRMLDDLLAESLLPEIQEHVVDKSVDFREAYTTEAICCPARATYLSGLYPHNSGINQNFLLYDALPGVEKPTELEGDPGIVKVPQNLPEDKVMLGAIGKFDDTNTIAVRLQARGYTTGHVGKYLHGYGGHTEYQELSPAFNPRYVPPGWDQWAALIDPTTYCVYNYAMNINGQLKRYELPEGQTESDEIYQTQVVSDLSVSFIRQSQTSGQPFFLQVMPITPHAETCAEAYAPDPPPGSGYADQFLKRIRVPPQDAGRYVPSLVPRGAYDDDNSDKPDWLAALPPLAGSAREPALAEQFANRARSMYAIDRMVGALFDALEPAVAEQTIVIFTSDNGWLNGEHRLTGKKAGYDESTGVPLYVRYPGRTEPATSDAMVINTDYVPTLLDLTGFNYEPREFDGTSFAPFIVDPARTDVPKRERFLIEYFVGTFLPNGNPSFLAVRERNVLYIESDSSEFLNPERTLLGLEFYDLVSDPNQAQSTIRLGEGEAPALYPALIDRLSTCRGPRCQRFEFLQIPGQN